MKKKEMYISSDGLLVIEGKKYIESVTKYKMIDGIEHIDKTLLLEFDEKDFNKKVSHIAQVLSKQLDKEDIVNELVKKKPINEINALYKLFTESKIKSLKVQKGCLGIKINSGEAKTGGGYIELIN